MDKPGNKLVQRTTTETIVAPKASCKHCYGRGYIGTDPDIPGRKVSCRCTRRKVKAKEKVEQTGNFVETDAVASSTDSMSNEMGMLDSMGEQEKPVPVSEQIDELLEGKPMLDEDGKPLDIGVEPGCSKKDVVDGPEE